MPKTSTIESLYRQHGHSVLRRARRILGAEDDARDVLQEVFASMVETAPSFRGDSSITTWLYSATTHRCLNRLRNEKTRARLLAREQQHEAAAAPLAEHRVIVAELLASIPDELAEVAIFHYVDEMTHDEIARVIGCSRRHVGDLIARLRASVREGEEKP